MTITLVVLAAVVLLLVTDWLRMDLAALLAALALAWTGVLTPAEALSGFSSNAVIAMISLMILGRGVTRSGMMDRFAAVVSRVAGRSRRKLLGLVLAAAGALSAFIQNIGSAVLFLPVVLGISRREGIPKGELIMPLGFAAILGGTLTMAGSGPLILTNDFLRNAGLQPYGLFAVTPAGLAIFAAGIALFLLFGRFVLPREARAGKERSFQQELVDAWRLPFVIHHTRIPRGSPLIGKTPEQAGIWDRFHLNLLALSRNRDVEYAPWRETRFEAGQDLALLGEESNVSGFARENGLEVERKPGRFAALDDPSSAGFAEVIVPPRSALAGSTIRSYGLRHRTGVEPVVLVHQDAVVRGDFSDREIASGDTFIVHGLWEKILEMKSGGDFVVVTPCPAEKKDPAKALRALSCFVLAIALALSGLPISISFLSGAVAMILSGVLSADEAYGSVDWKVIFFIAGLIPIGLAMQKSGSARFLAERAVALIGGASPLLVYAAVSALSTLFSLFLSNVAAAVILAPLVIGMASVGGLDARPLVLLMAVSAANSFLLPTHQVNALLKAPGGYRNRDYLKAGGALTAVFFTMAVTVFFLLYR